jgi:DNA-binding GntR family transcriptional regulator
MGQSDEAVAVLQRLIERGDLEPGSMVSERQLMELSGLGRTPVREAIQRLALSYMMRIHPNKGIEVPGISVEDQLNSLEVRRANELLAVELACARATPKDLLAIASLADELEVDFNLDDYIETVRETHKLIIQAAHNPYLEALMTPLQSLSRRFWVMHIQDEKKAIERGKKLHIKILRGIEQRNFKAASEASLELNDYLVEFALEVVTKMAVTRTDIASTRKRLL